MQQSNANGTGAGADLVPGIIARFATSSCIVFEPRTPDRTAALRGLGPSPLPFLQDSAARLAAMGASHLGVPCNSAHVFVRQALDSGEWRSALAFVDMIDAAAGAAAARGRRAPGILATTGTIGGGLYHRALERLGLSAVVPSDEEQETLVMEAIYGQGGIKAGVTVGRPQDLMREAAARLVRRGADALILGCTEVPLVLHGADVRIDGRSIPLIDSTQELANALRARPGVAGVAGGMGPEATIDLAAKMGGPAGWIDVMRAVFRSTIELTGATRDQDHLVMAAATGPDLAEAADRVTRGGASFLVVPSDDADAVSGLVASSPLPVVTGPLSTIGAIVVRAARHAGRGGRR